MADFSAFIQIGLKAATDAVAARAEIAAVFQDVNQHLDAAFQGKVKLEIKELHELPGIGSILNALANPKKYSALVITSPEKPAFVPREIARWKRSVNGYPCWIITGGQEVSCEDRVALEQELGNLLSSAPVGEAILAAKSSGPSGLQLPA